MHTYNGQPTAEGGKRVDRAGRLMDIYAERLNISVTRDSDELVRTLLTDLLHWSDTYAVDFDKELQSARDAYQAEQPPA